ncbi:MAG: dodecin domain-containing protein [Candidatus Thorarchaeota archaeon]|jgi:flavin-binding protein dodecin
MVSPGYKSIQLVATSDKNWKDAVMEAYKVAKQSIHGIRTIQILQRDVKVKEDVDKLIYRVRVRVNFQLAER